MTAWQAEAAPKTFKNNAVHTAKYSLLTFIPKNLFEQFRRLSNVFFLLVAILQQFPGISPTGRYTTALPLGLVLLVTACKEAFEDFQRHRSDKETNRRIARVLLASGEIVERQWQEIHVGDVLVVQAKEQFPADLLLLWSTEAEGMAYIETSNLDGETNLKTRQIETRTAHLFEDGKIDALATCSFEYEPPNVHIYDFNGTMTVDGSPTPLSNKQILLRGAVLRNTKRIHGVVLYAGHDTKIMRNSMEPPSKRTSIERATNWQIATVLILELVLCLLCTTGYNVWARSHTTQIQLNLVASALALETFKTFFTFFILFNNLIPISLYVSMELVKFIQARMIAWDGALYDPVTNTPAAARTSNLNEELGQIEHLFSDKTGTLTENVMKFRKISIAGKSYALRSNDEERLLAKAAAAEARRSKFPSRQNSAAVDSSTTDVESTRTRSQAANSSDHPVETLLEDLTADTPQASWNERAMILMALCHAVVPETDAATGATVYQASSPDEIALVTAAKALGFNFKSRLPNSVCVSVRGTDYSFRLLNVLEFTSTRKRMSVIIRFPDGVIRLLAKGADTAIIERLAPGQSIVDITVHHLARFAEDGFRTLLLAERVISEKEYAKWLKHVYNPASTAIENRRERLAEAAEAIEVQLSLVGATAIEDKLQDGVPGAIAALSAAGIRIWMLTGDKQETAINIGYSCKLLTSAHSLLVVNEETEEGTLARLRAFNAQLDKKAATQGAVSTGSRGSRAQALALVIDGGSLQYALLPALSQELLRLALRCQSVIACRVSPLQKAFIVKLVRHESPPPFKPVTLAVGDGANDVSMIHAAHVGVGISGREGLQAARAADYSVAQFRFLVRLLLVHGAWDHRRIATLILYSFHKNVALYLVQFWFALYNGYSGQTIFERWTISLYNVLFTSLPIVVHSIFDQEISARMSLRYPALYWVSQRGEFFNTRVFWLWMGAAVYSSFLFFFLVTLATSTVAEYSGRAWGQWEQGVMIYTAVVVTVNLKLALQVHNFTVLHLFAFGASVLGWYLFVAVYSQFSFAPETYGLVLDLYGSAMFWIITLFVPVLVLFVDILFMYCQRTFFPTPAQIVQEVDALQSVAARVIGRFQPTLEIAKLLKTLPLRQHNLDRATVVAPYAVTDDDEAAMPSMAAARERGHTSSNGALTSSLGGSDLALPKAASSSSSDVRAPRAEIAMAAGTGEHFPRPKPIARPQTTLK